MTAARPHGRTRHAGEHGFTLIEVLVSVMILAIIGGVVGGAFSVGLKVVGGGGSQDRLASAHDQTVFEEVLSRDVSRAVCLDSPGHSSAGTCSDVPSSCSAALLCAAWPDFSDNLCHAATYTLQLDSSGIYGQVFRREYAGNTLRSTRGVTTTRLNPVTFQVSAQSQFQAPSGVTWVHQLTIVVTSARVASSVRTGTFVVRPLSPDPGGPAAQVGAPSC